MLPHGILPGWVPEQSLRYLAHTEAGRSIRDLARHEACHPSTILRQIRRLETRRDDPLVDEVLKSLGRYIVNRPTGPATRGGGQIRRGPLMDFSASWESDTSDPLPSDAELAQEAVRILRRMCETGSVLAIAADMDKAVVVRDMPGGATARTAVVDRGVARAMALNEWITCQGQGRVARYVITQAGRTALGQMIARQENQRAKAAQGFGEAQAALATETDASPEARARKPRYVASESPLCGLARRKDRDGQPFLTEALVAAGERLREDFELAQMGAHAGQNWDHLLTGGVQGGASGSGVPRMGANAAQDRVLAALDELGPGLSDVALRCCCYLDGLESAEKRLGWSARSGKIVLRIALQRLKRHYAGLSAADQMIG